MGGSMGLVVAVPPLLGNLKFIVKPFADRLYGSASNLSRDFNIWRALIYTFVCADKQFI